MFLVERLCFSKYALLICLHTNQAKPREDKIILNEVTLDLNVILQKRRICATCHRLELKMRRVHMHMLIVVYPML